MIIIISSDNVVTRNAKNLRWPNGDTCHHTWASALFAQDRFTRAASRVTFHPYEELP